MSPVEDRLFLRWRRSGDPAELAEVYDRTSAGLLRLALHLTPQPAHAEDLVQATFVAAIEAADRYDGTRPLLGWLTGILHNQARWLNRSEARSPDAARLRQQPVADPVELAASAEFTAQVDDAIATLPEVYHPVLRLSLKHHMPAAEIAHVLGRPAGTVRSQVVRGLELLRSALPKGAVGAALGAAFAALLPRRGMAAVREHVLATGEAHAAAATGLLATAGILIVMKKVAFVVAASAAVLAVMFGVGAFDPSAGTTGVAPPDTTPARETASDAVAEQAASQSSNPVGPGTSAQRVAAAPPEVGGKQTEVFGRCVDDAGRPLADCTVKLSASKGDDGRVQQWLLEHGELPAWTDPDDIVTDADGRFAFTFCPPAPFRFTLHAAHLRRVSAFARWSALEAGTSVDVGDVLLSTGVRVHGRMVDSHGVPQGQRRVSLHREPTLHARPGQPQPSSGSYGLTRADGTFTLVERLAAGRYHPAAPSGLTLESPTEVELSLQRPEERIELVVTSPEDAWHITGVVLDAAGEPVYNVEVRADFRRSDERHSARTRPNGTFDLRTTERPKGHTVALVVDAPGFECDPESREVAWGSRDVEFRVARGGLLTVRVADTRQRPVERYRVRLIPRNSHASGTGSFYKPFVGEHPDGVATLPGLTSGEWIVSVTFPESHNLDMLFEPLTLEAPHPVRLDLVARPPAERTVRVLAMDGTPMASSKVRLFDGFGAQVGSLALTPFDSWHLVLGMANVALELREFETDSDGRAVLRGPVGRDLGIEVSGAAHVTTRFEPVRIGPASELIVRVVEAAGLRGTVGPPEALAELRRLAEIEPEAPFGRWAPYLNLKAIVGHERFPPLGADPKSPLRIQDDGSFSAGSVPAGTWQVELHYMRRPASNHIVVGEVTLVAGSTTVLDLDASGLLPGTLEGVVHHNGAPLADHYVTLVSGGGYHEGVRTDASGHFVLRAIPGTCACEVRLGEGSNLESSNTIEIVRSETRRGVFELFSGRVRLRLVDPDGEPVSQTRLMRRSADLPNGYFLPTTDIEGRVTLDLAPGRHTLHALPRGLDTNEATHRLWRQAHEAGREDAYGPHLLQLAEITLQAGDDQEVELRLPEAWRR